MATVTTTRNHTDQLPRLHELPAEHLFDMHVDLEPAQPIATPVGARMTFIARGGGIERPRLRGEILPGGGHDHALIHYEARGIIKIPADGLARLAAGNVLPFEETNVRTTPTFETADERYAWLNEVVAVGYNILSPNHIDYRIYRVL